MTLTSAPPLETLTHRVGHTSTLTVDASRNDRLLGIDIWYPASTDSGAITEYELIPGVRFTSASAHENSPISPGAHPLIVWSHGRTGTRHNYSLLCEALASRGYIVISPDHPGDGLFDWFLGNNVDDVTNERNRQGDLRLCIDAALGHHAPLTNWLTDSVDPQRVFVGGHSYGGLSALATTSHLHEFAPDDRVRATVVAQAYTRTMSTEFFASLTQPTLLLVGQADTTTPPSTDANPAWNILQARTDNVAQRSSRFDLVHTPHQGCSDFVLYNELAPQVEGIPEAVLGYLGTIAADIPAEWFSTWRQGLQQHAHHIDEFLKSV
jgi:pimeloyl-ACP methyl ester carboxylesterase